MKLKALELPEESNDWPKWLERELVGSHLREFVQQLEVIQGNIQSPVAGSWSQQLNEDFGQRLADIFESGLSVLDEDEFRRLISTPRLLLALQQRVIVDGGIYWDRVPKSNEHMGLSETLATQISRSLSSKADSPSQPLASPQVELPTKKTYRRWFFAVAGIAATLLVGMFLWSKTETNGKFFARKGLLDSPQRDKDFLQQLAKAVEEDWQDKNSNFESKLAALIKSCDILLEASLSQLDKEVAKELRSRCQKWKTALSGFQQEIERNGISDDLIDRTNGTVEKLILALPGLS